MPKEHAVAPSNPVRSLPVEHRGAPPSFGTGVETKLEKSGLHSSGYDLVFASAKVPVRKMVPLMRQGADGSLMQVGERDMIIEEPTQILAGVSRVERRSGQKKTEEKIIHDNGSTHVLLTETTTPSHDVEVITMFKESELLQMDKEAMATLHIVDSTSLSAASGQNSTRFVEGVLVTTCFADPKSHTYSYVQATIHKEGGAIARFSIEHEEPFT